MKKLERITDKEIKNGTYQIPKEYDEIRTVCFAYSKTLEYIEIPDNIKKIGRSAFYGCLNLKTVKMTNSIKTIDNYAFLLCKSLTELYLSDNVELKSVYFGLETNQKCKVYHRGHSYTVEDIRLYY